MTTGINSKTLLVTNLPAYVEYKVVLLLAHAPSCAEPQLMTASSSAVLF